MVGPELGDLVAPGLAAEAALLGAGDAASRERETESGQPAELQRPVAVDARHGEPTEQVRRQFVGHDATSVAASVLSGLGARASERSGRQDNQTSSSRSAMSDESDAFCKNTSRSLPSAV